MFTWLFIVLVLVATADARRSRARSGARRRARQKRDAAKCKVPNCDSCESASQNSCYQCAGGFGLTEEKRCGACAPGCASCDTLGAGGCDFCSPGHTSLDGHCRRCADKCLTCDSAGPGNCDKNGCEPRYMLETDFSADASKPDDWDESEDGVFEPPEPATTCVSCSAGCYKCVAQTHEGCVQCDSVFDVPTSTGCARSYLRVCAAIITVVGVLGWCLLRSGSRKSKADERQQAQKRTMAAMGIGAGASLPTTSTATSVVGGVATQRRPEAGSSSAGGDGSCLRSAPSLDASSPPQKKGA